MAKSTDYRGIHISIRYEYGYDYYEIREINKGKKWNDVTLFSTLKEAKQYIDDHYDELVELCNVKESKSSATKSIEESKDITIEEFISDYKNNDCFSIRDKENGHESECFWGSKKDVLDSDYRLFTVLDTDVNKETDDTILYIDLEENAWVESKKSATKSIVEEYDPTDDIINKGNSVGMDYETFLEFAEKQDYKFNVTDATFYFGINGNIKIEGKECSCIPSEDGILIIDNHSSIEIPRKDIDEVSGVSLNSKNVLRVDVFTKDGDALTVWWEL